MSDGHTTAEPTGVPLHALRPGGGSGPRVILGISAFYHDAAAALLVDGRICAAASEESFSRIKHDANFPAQAIRYCLTQAGLTTKDLEVVVFYDKPFVKFERILSSALSTFPKSLPQFMEAMPLWLGQKLWVPQTIRDELLFEGELLFAEHHQSHAASAFFCSPFEQAAVLTVDGVGEWATTSRGLGHGLSLELTHELRFPHSLGLLYSAITGYLGFKVNSAEYKVMGLAPYGQPTYREAFRELIDIREDGSFRINLDYFTWHYAMKMTHPKLDGLLGGPPRPPDAPLTQRHKDLAASLQEVVNEVMVKLAWAAHRDTGLRRLCMAGGVALNCVANGEILRRTPMKEIFVQPAASDAGGALGAALWAWHCVYQQPRVQAFPPPYLGPEFTDDQIEAALKAAGAVYTRHDRQEMLEKTSELIDAQQVVGWFQGRLEWGPRALGHRSILGDARSASMRDTINLKIKFREGFRPFAPAVLAEHAQEWFDLEVESPYMLLVAPVREERRTIPAVTHVDYSARVQTVTREQEPLFYDLIETFYRRTGTPIVINTSFNVRGEPIVTTPSEAYACFMRTDMDHLVIGSYVLSKAMQPVQPGQVRGAGMFQPD